MMTERGTDACLFMEFSQVPELLHHSEAPLEGGHSGRFIYPVPDRPSRWPLTLLMDMGNGSTRHFDLLSVDVKDGQVEVAYQHGPVIVVVRKSAANAGPVARLAL